MAAGLVILEDDEQLRKLAKVIYYQEAESIKNIKFNSEPERAKYLRECKTNYESVLGLLNSGGELKRRFGNDDERTRSSVANDIYSYILYCINSALQTVRNYTLRTKYLCKIGEHVRSIVKALEELNMVGNDAATRVATLGEEVLLYKNAMLRYVKEHRSTASKNFSRGIRESGLKLEDVVKRYQKEKLKIDGPFKDLKDEQKLEVYEAIIEASGRGIDATKKISKALGKMPSKALKVAGIAVFLFSAGMMVWDIFSSDHIIQAATHEAVVSVASMGGAPLGSVVSAALTSRLVGVAASSLFVTVTGIVCSIVGAFIIGAFAGWFIDLVFGSGGSAPFSTDGHRCYVAPLPDGETLARQIAHRTKFSN